MRAWNPSLCAALLVAGSMAAQAAMPFTETFTGGLAGWTNDASTLWTASSNRAMAVLPSGPATARLVAGPGASSGAFTGDYTAAGVTLIGFSVLLEIKAPASELSLAWSSGSNTFTRNFREAAAQTGVWYQFAVTLAGKTNGLWDGVGSEQDFQDALAQVDSVAFVAKSPLFDAMTVYLDDVFIERMHASTKVQTSTNGYGDITWSYVRSNIAYRLEYSDALAAGWSTAAVVTATSTSLVTSVPLTNTPDRAYRLVLP